MSQALSPACTHRSYKATISSFEMDSDVGDDGGCSCGGRLECAPSRTMLAQVGATLEGWGTAGEAESCDWVSPPLVDLPSTPAEGEAVRQGEGCGSLTPSCIYLHSTPVEGEARRRGGESCVCPGD